MVNGGRSAAAARAAQVLVIALCTVSTACAQGPEVVGPDARYIAVSRALTAFIDAEMREKGIPALSIALVDGDRVVWSRGFGIANRVTKRPATAQTVYRVGSVSKLFNDIGIMQRVERGALNLDAPVQRYLQQRVLAPLGMTSSSFVVTPALRARLADAEMWTYHDRSFPAPAFALGMAPAGSMYSTMPDLGRFISELIAGSAAPGGRILNAATLREMWRPQFGAPGSAGGRGLGFVGGSLDSALLVEHGGASYGFATQLSVLPDEKIGVAVSASKDGMNGLTTRIAHEALRLMRVARGGGDLPAPVSYGAVPRTLAQRFAGRFSTSGDSTISVTVHDSSVSLTSPLIDARLGMRWLRGDTLIVDDGVSFGQKAWLNGDRLMFAGASYSRLPVLASLPDDAPAQWRGLIGEYGWDFNTFYILERDGKLSALIEWFFEYPLTEVSENVFAFPSRGLYANERIEFTRDANGRATAARVAGIAFARRTWIGEDGGIFRVTPVKPVAQLQALALHEQPPVERGDFLPTDLAELAQLDSSIHLDIRYASDRNFLSTPFYSQARAFMQRPAAEAVVRAHRALARQGYGLLIHDGYRPWYVTKMFWDGTPPDKHTFVANPASGSKHNRGCAVDLTMYDLRTGQPVVMTGGYDEMSDRSYPEYPGGTSRQRALREMLRAAMEAEGFSVDGAEWWHFDYKDWRRYRIANTRFEELKS
jgi:D-alanyl-D-alanine dipeptidase/CubicO group peptidase (beta-lactamase class C family)